MIIDTFPTFLDYWEDYKDLPIDQQINGWAGEYLSQWSELVHKQIEDYDQEGYDWREIAREKIFPYIPERFPAMAAAYKNLATLCKPVHEKCKVILEFEFEIVFIIYVGIGLGAGWASTYGGKPAVLFGLENIAEEGWTQSEILSGLISHEIGHLAHFHWRDEVGLSKGSGPWWQLFIEGFAQFCEGQVSPDSWHMDTRREEDWLSYCQGNVSWLAGKFLRRVDAAEDVRDFFGSWFDIEGFKQTGYFLGYELIKEISKETSLMKIAVLEDYETPLRNIMKTLSN